MLVTKIKSKDLIAGMWQVIAEKGGNICALYKRISKVLYSGEQYATAKHEDNGILNTMKFKDSIVFASRAPW